MKSLVVSLLKTVHEKTGLSYAMIVLIIGICMTALSLTTLVSFYFAYRARESCKDRSNKMQVFTGLLIASVVLYLGSFFGYRIVLIPAALMCNIALIALSYKYCKDVAVKA